MAIPFHSDEDTKIRRSKHLNDQGTWRDKSVVRDFYSRISIYKTIMQITLPSHRDNKIVTFPPDYQKRLRNREAVLNINRYFVYIPIYSKNRKLIVKTTLY